MKEQVLQAMREAGKPVSAGDVTKALGVDRKEVDKAFAELKKEGAIVSPVRCKWEPAAKQQSVYHNLQKEQHPQFGMLLFCYNDNRMDDETTSESCINSRTFWN